MNIANDLVRAFNDGYEKGKADAEAYLLHCGDTDEPQTNADRIRSMTDEELANLFPTFCAENCDDSCPPPRQRGSCHSKGCEACWLDWLREEVSDGK